MSENMQFPIPNSVLEPYIKAAVSTAIASALGDGTKLVEKAVQAALTHKVNSKGVVSPHSYENQYGLVEVVAANKIQSIAREVVSQMAEGMRPAIEKSVTAHLQKRNNVIAAALVDGLIGSLKTTWNVQVSLEPKSKL